MAIVGDRPQTGVRVALSRPGFTDEPPWRYEGFVHLPDRDFVVAAAVEADGAVTVELAEGAPRELGERVRLIVRSVWRGLEGAAPARKIVRWRADK